MSNVMLTPEELRDLKHMCSDPFMELGMTLRPKHLDCLKEHVATHSLIFIVEFEEHSDAVKWNKTHETLIRKGGHIATIAITISTMMLTKNPKLSGAIGATASILKDEVQARIWYPKMYEGWLLNRHFVFRYKQFPSRQFSMRWTDVIQDDSGAVQETREHGMVHFKVGGPNGIPEKTIRNLMTQFPVRTLKYK